MTDPYEVALTIAGVAALAAAWLPSYLQRRAMSLPIVLVAIGAAAFWLVEPLPTPAAWDHLELTERLTEAVVIISLMGAGLRIDRPFAWRTWSTTWRLLAVAMPLTIILVAMAGWAIAGLSLASAALLGAVLAPTDPVLASDVQVGEPTLEREPTPDAEDEVRFALTSEGGLNDALAFPFVYAAIALGGGVVTAGDVGRWALWDLAGRCAIALAVGWLVGRLLGRIAFRPPGPLSALADTPQGFVAVAATLVAYGATELLSGYGFLAVFVAAVTLRNVDPTHAFHGHLHTFVDQTENLAVVGLLLLLGGSVATGALDGLTWGGAVVAALVVFVVRPLSGALALSGSRLSTEERTTVAFFGIRGFGSIYYLAYALSSTAFADADSLWAVVSLSIVISIGTHGLLATPAMRMVDRANSARTARSARAR